MNKCRVFSIFNKDYIYDYKTPDLKINFFIIAAVIVIVIAQLFNNSTWNSKPDARFQLNGHIALA